MKGSALQVLDSPSLQADAAHGLAVTPFLKGAEMAALKCKEVYSPLQGEGIMQKLIQFMMQVFLVWHIKYCKYISFINRKHFCIKNFHP